MTMTRQERDDLKEIKFLQAYPYESLRVSSKRALRLLSVLNPEIDWNENYDLDKYLSTYSDLQYAKQRRLTHVRNALLNEIRDASH